MAEKPKFAKLETTHRVHSEIGAAFGYAIADGFTDYDPVQAVAAQIPAQKVNHRTALTEPKDVAQPLRDIVNYQYPLDCHRHSFNGPAKLIK